MRQHRADLRGDPRVALARHLAGRAQRRNPGREQGFGHVDVAHAHHHPLVHQEGLHRRLAATAQPEQVVAVEVLTQRLRAQPGQQRMRLSGRLPQQAAEAPRVGEAQHATVAHEPDVDVVVRPGRGVAGQHAQAAGHAQVQQGAARGGVEQEVLGAPAHGVDALPREAVGDLGRDRPAQVGAAQQHVAHARAFEVRRQSAARGLDFGQLRHAGSVGARRRRRKAAKMKRIPAIPVRRDGNQGVRAPS